MRNKQEKRMSITKCFLQNHVLISVLLVIALRPIAIEAASESDRLERLERAVEQLQKRNAELEAEVRSLKKQTVSVPEGKMKTKVTHDGKSYVEMEVVEEEKAPLYVFQRGLELKLVLGGYIQANFEGGDVSAFEGRFGQTALDDRFRCAGRGSI
jgi:cell division protein FtsB